MATNDVDSSTGRARLSYRRAAEMFEGHTVHYDDGPYTLHQLLTHAAEEGASTPVLMELSGQMSVRSLAKYARISDGGATALSGRQQSGGASSAGSVIGTEFRDGAYCNAQTRRAQQA
ncbi:hypothetical protein [Rhodococcoides yunnanense]|uniref:hypothetical protein n=1 Tax=Rhodococcoides yunnanense TaxID=278209 RepID=UPI001FE2AF33|nr:hypothetical protein [Rhodococcus yunnanensis]